MPVATFGMPPGTRTNIHRLSPADSNQIPSVDTLVWLVDQTGNAGGYLSQRQVDLSKALRRGARFVFAFGPGWEGGWKSDVIQWLAGRLRFQLMSLSSLEIRALVPELRTFFENQRAHAHVNLAGTLESYIGLQGLGEAIDITGQAAGTASLRYREGEAEIVFVPLHGLAEDTEDVVLDFLSRLPQLQDYPTYLDAIELHDEAALRAELGEIERRREAIAEELAEDRRTKQILFFAELDLEHEVVRFLDEELDIAARHVPGTDEDFRLLDESGEECGIGEVKGYERKSVPRTDLARVAIHRAEAGLDEDAPALLVANTFHAATSVSERDQPIAPNVFERASDDHILIVRTLDLIRLKQLALAGKPQTDKLVEALRQRGGWFEVDADFEIQLHPKAP
jgi:hypothetical protein